MCLKNFGLVCNTLEGSLNVRSILQLKETGSVGGAVHVLGKDLIYTYLQVSFSL